MAVSEQLVQEIVKDVLAKMQLQPEANQGKMGVFDDMNAAIAAANGADGEKTLKLYQDVRASYELTRGPVTLDVNGKNASDLTITVKGIQLTVTGTGTIWSVTASGSSAVVINSTVEII